MTRSAPPAARPAFSADTIRAMALFPLNPGHSDLDNEQPISVRVGDAWVGCTLGDIRQAQREAGALGAAVREARRVNGALVLAFDLPDARALMLAEAQRHAGDLGSMLARLTLAATVEAGQ